MVPPVAWANAPPCRQSASGAASIRVVKKMEFDFISVWTVVIVVRIRGNAKPIPPASPASQGRTTPARPIPRTFGHGPPTLPAQKRKLQGPGCKRKCFHLDGSIYFAAKAELAFCTPRRFASAGRGRGADRSWSACAPAPLSHQSRRFLQKPICHLHAPPHRGKRQGEFCLTLKHACDRRLPRGGGI